MSQTETLLLFVLGFCVALFVVLLFGRGVFAVLGQWSGWRETRMQPAAIRELQAERDQLKAEKAMMAQKMDASLSDMKMRLAEQMAEVSRNRNRLLDAQQTILERETTITHLHQQVDEKGSASSSLQSQIEENVKAINLAYAKVAQREEEHVKMQNLLKDAQATLLLRDEKIRNLLDEAKSLREVVGNLPAQNPLLAAASDESGTSPQMFENRLTAEQRTDEAEGFSGSGDMERSISNVLSLAERVRSLQTGMKKG